MRTARSRNAVFGLLKPTGGRGPNHIHVGTTTAIGVTWRAGPRGMPTLLRWGIIDNEFFRQRRCLPAVWLRMPIRSPKSVFSNRREVRCHGGRPRAFASFARYRAAQAFCERVALIGHGRQDMKKPKPDAAAIEVECDACGGTGYPPVKEISP
jgi:hypothetical protein